MKKLVFIILLLNTQLTQAQDLSGSEFWFTLPEGFSGVDKAADYRVKIISEHCGNYTLSFPGLDYTLHGVYSAGNPAEILLTPIINGDTVYHTQDRLTQLKGIKINTSSKAMAYLIIPEEFSSGAETILPYRKLGTNYVLGFESGMRPSSVKHHPRTTIIATEDSTNLEIKTWNNGVDSNQTHVGNQEIIKLQLNAGETFLFSQFAYNTGNDWYTNYEIHAQTGSVINSSKPVAVMSSTPCADVSYCGPCDMLITMPLPTHLWAKNYTTVQNVKRTYPSIYCDNENTLADFIQVVGKIGTHVNFRGTAIDTNIMISAPNYATDNHYGYGRIIFNNPRYNDGSLDGGPEVFGEANLVISSDSNIFVTQYAKAGGYDNPSGGPNHREPEAFTVYPTHLWESSYMIPGKLNKGIIADRLNMELVIITTRVTRSSPSGIYLDGINVNDAPYHAEWQAFGPTEKNLVFTRIMISNTQSSKLVSKKGEKMGVYFTGISTSDSFIIQGAYASNFSANCLTSEVVQLEEELTTHIYPNPATNYLNIANKDLNGLTISIHSTDGTKYMEQYGNSQKITLDIHHLPKGVYIVKLQSKEHEKVVKLIKE